MSKQTCENVLCVDEANHYLAFGALAGLRLCDRHYGLAIRSRKFVEMFGMEAGPEAIHNASQGNLPGSDLEAAILLILMFQISHVFCGGKP